MVRLISWGVLVLQLAVACAQEPTSVEKVGFDPWTHRWWLEKTGRTLWTEAPPGPEEFEGLATLSRQQAVARLIADERFGNAVLRFNLFLLDWELPSLFTVHPVSGERVFHQRLAWKPQAIVSAVAVMRGGDYFSMFDDTLPWVHFPVGRAFLTLRPGEPPPPDADTMSEAEKRARNLGVVEQTLGEVEALLWPAEGEAAVEPACEVIRTRLVSDGLNAWIASGFEEFDPELGLLNPWSWEFLLPTLLQGLIGACTAAPGTEIDAAVVRETVARYRQTLRGLFRVADDFLPRRQQVVTEIPLIDPDRYALGMRRTQFSVSDMRLEQNSSTNLNRRRAAHVLRTFFCDDLTPVSIPIPTPGSGGPHASDAACQACHYKLDPMAGFFRYTDALGVTDPNRTFLFFSDGEVAEDERYQAYLDNWRGDGGQSWNIGYVRSPDHPERNTYGESLTDLSSLLRSAPEVRQCVVRRMAEYFLGAEQTVDTAWLEWLASRLQPGPGSGEAFKQVVAELVMSEAFSTIDPDPGHCYDLAPDDHPSAVPCVVASLLRKNCGGCHHDTRGNGHLDLTGWIDAESGEDGFPHLDASGAQIPARETFARMVERISSSDPLRAMPLGVHMDSLERQRLYSWLVQRLEGP